MHECCLCAPSQLFSNSSWFKVTYLSTKYASFFGFFYMNRIIGFGLWLEIIYNIGVLIIQSCGRYVERKIEIRGKGKPQYIESGNHWG